MSFVHGREGEEGERAREGANVRKVALFCISRPEEKVSVCRLNLQREREKEEGWLL